MKKYLALVLFFAPLLTSAISLEPNQVTINTGMFSAYPTCSIEEPTGGNEGYYVFYPPSYEDGEIAWWSGACFSNSGEIEPLFVGSYVVYEFTDLTDIGDCQTRAECEPYSISSGTFTVLPTPRPVTGKLFVFTDNGRNSASDLLANVGSVSTDVIKSAGGWISLAIGVLVAFYLAITLVPLVIPKEKKEKNKKQ